MCRLCVRALARFLRRWARSVSEGWGLWGVVRVPQLLVQLWLGPGGVTCELGGFGGLGGFNGCGHGFGAVGRGRCPLAHALVSIGSRFGWLFLGGVPCAVRLRCPAG